MDPLDSLENESIHVIREAHARVKNLGMLWSMGKDSTVMLHLARKAFLGRIPFPVLHIDTSYKIPEMIAWRDALARRDGFRLVVHKNQAALDSGMGPEKGKLTCCGALKTDALLDAIRVQDFGGLLVGIRRDEEGSRGKERVVSPRPGVGGWAYKEQPAELWGYYNLHLDAHLRVHPLLHWTELDVWEYIRREGLEVMPLYFAKGGRRYRSLGCAPCTGTVASSAADLDGIIAELQATRTPERAGRAQDQADAYAMQKLRRTGYM